MTKKGFSASAEVDTSFYKKNRCILILTAPIILVLTCFIILLVFNKIISLDKELETYYQTAYKQQFSHPDLPGFSFDIPEGWDVEITKLFDVVDLEQYSDPVYECYENCMTIKLSKGDLSFNMEFTRDFSTHIEYEVSECSNSAEYESLGNSWYKVIDNGKVLYTRDVRFNVRVDDRYIPVAKQKEDSSFELINGNTYRICKYDHFETSNILKEESPTLDADKYNAVRMDDIVINQKIDPALITEINHIISSIQGFRNAFIEPDMSDWNEYKNTKYGFSLKYPDQNLIAAESPIFLNTRESFLVCPQVIGGACPSFPEPEYEIRFSDENNNLVLGIYIYNDEEGLVEFGGRFGSPRIKDGLTYMVVYNGDAVTTQMILESISFIEKDKPTSCLWIGSYGGYSKEEVADTEKFNRSTFLDSTWGFNLTEEETEIRLKEIRDSLVRHYGWKYDWDKGCVEDEYYTYGESKGSVPFKTQQECMQACEN